MKTQETQREKFITHLFCACFCALIFGLLAGFCQGQFAAALITGGAVLVVTLFFITIFASQRR